MYHVKLDDACTTFSLYKDNHLEMTSVLVGNLLQSVADQHHIDISFCVSESHMLVVLQEHLDIEVVDDY